MIWLYPAAAVALVAVAAPVFIHILARQRARRVPFPTLRFIQEHTLASTRRRTLEDAALLAVRVAIVLLSAAAVAGPFFVTVARQRAWDAQTIRTEISNTNVREGLVRATAWLTRQPPGRREIVIRGALPIGSVAQSDIAEVAPNIGIRFERTATLPAARLLSASTVVENGRLVQRETTLNRDRTLVRDVGSGGDAPPPIEIVAPADQKASADLLRVALDRERLPVPRDDHRARVSFAQRAPSASNESTIRDESAIRNPQSAIFPWVADAASEAAREIESSELLNGINAQFGSEASIFLVRTSIPASDPRALELLRTVARTLGPSPERPADEIVPIADAQLRAWSREAAPAGPPDREMIGRDDRRWLWALVLLLIAAETWMRRGRRAIVNSTKESSRAA